MSLARFIIVTKEDELHDREIVQCLEYELIPAELGRLWVSETSCNATDRSQIALLQLRLAIRFGAKSKNHHHC